MVADKDKIISWLADLSATIVTDSDDLAAVASRVLSAGKLSATEFAPESIDLMRIIAESVSAPTDFDRIVVPSTISDTGTVAAASVLLSLGLSVACGRVSWPSRPAARNARSRVVVASDAALDAASTLGADGADLYAWLSSIADVAIRLISEIAANAVPIVRVQTGVSQSSTVLAYQLYGDASRASSLVDIAGASTPLVMPVTFEALAY